MARAREGESAPQGDEGTSAEETMLVGERVAARKSADDAADDDDGGMDLSDV